VANSLYVHANAELPARWQQRLQGWIMTPHLHRIHHSQVRVDNDSNIGVVLMLWDRVCGSFRAEPEGGRNHLRIGLPDADPQHFLDVGAILTEPFRRTGRDLAAPRRNS
jgi:sterol desaturase/sphingolipid hydroxylase (fatty acid hydroxylase superfamily)